MTENRRILLNIVATYGRSLYGLVLGLLCGRWALMALGETDYGLNGLVAGLSSFITFFNGILAASNARFYAYSVGAAKVADDKNSALEECRHWFNTSLSIHMVVPLLLLVVGYPIGEYAVRHWLTIPADRIQDCVWVFRFCCVSCFVGMTTVPFSAMYTAKQYIAELTIYGFVTSTLNVIVLYYMVNHPAVWLVEYSAVSCLLAIVPASIIAIRACYIFPECRMRLSYMWDRVRIAQIASFSGWSFFGNLCGILRTNGISILINKLFGAKMNAALAVGTSVQGHCYSLAGAMQGAFSPVITQACGAKDYQKMNEFALRSCKFNVLLGLIFVLPLAVELEEVMVLWLKNPPAYSVGLCYCAMFIHFAGCCTIGHCIAVIATGKIKQYYLCMSIMNIGTLPMAVLVGICFRNVYAVMVVLVSMEMVNSLGRICFARKLCGMSVRKWMWEVMMKILLVSSIAIGAGWVVRQTTEASLGRVLVSTLIVESVLLPLAWLIVLDASEKVFVRERILGRLVGLLGGRK